MANTALTYLNCGANQLTSLNVSANTALATLNCSNNQLTSLNVYVNIALSVLGCYNNQLTSLNVSANTALTYLDCSYNQLTSLNVSANTALYILACYFNQLSSLNLQNGNNSNLLNFGATNNPALTCIQVDNPTLMNTNFGGINYIDAGASFSTNCNPPTNCYAHFMMLPDTVPHTWFAVNQWTGNGAINYVWNWGDGTPNDSTLNASHTYAAPGFYNICVSIIDSAGCTNSYCDSSNYIARSANTVISVQVVNQLPSYLITGVAPLSAAAEGALRCYPNPAKDVLYVEVGAAC